MERKFAKQIFNCKFCCLLLMLVVLLALMMPIGEAAVKVKVPKVVNRPTIGVMPFKLGTNIKNVELIGDSAGGVGDIAADYLIEDLVDCGLLEVIEMTAPLEFLPDGVIDPKSQTELNLVIPEYVITGTITYISVSHSEQGFLTVDKENKLHGLGGRSHAVSVGIVADVNYVKGGEVLFSVTGAGKSKATAFSSVSKSKAMFRVGSDEVALESVERAIESAITEVATKIINEV